MIQEERERGVLLGHAACPLHGGSDSLALYEKEECIDGFCYAGCGYVSPSKLRREGVTDGKSELLVDLVKEANGGYVPDEATLARVEKIKELPCSGWAERRIPTFVSEYYGVRTRKNDDNEVVFRYYPSTEKGEIVGWHVRDVDAKKSYNEGVKGDKPPFFPVGKVSATCELFGQAKFERGGKYAILTGGEEDAMAWFTAMNVEREGGSVKLKKFVTPVVSTTVGEGGIGQIRANYDWLTSFETVVIALDNDEAGRAAAEKIARLLKAGQAKVVKYRRKDACEHLKHGEYQDLVSMFWNAERFTPVDVLKLGELWDDFENEDANEKIPFAPAFAKINEMMNGGMERGEITVIGAYTSCGKSSVIMNNVYHWMENTRFKVGGMFLEGTKREVVRDLLSLDMGTNLRLINRSDLDIEKARNRFFNNLAAKDKFVYVDHQGSIANKEIFDKFHYLAKSEQCDIIILDVLQAAVNSSDNGAIIEFMDTLLKFAKETDTCLLVVSHMKKPDSDDPHAVSEYNLMGSSSINQIAFNTILMSRDKMHKSPVVRNSTHFVIPKCRRTGLTGDAGWVRYDPETTFMYATTNPYESEIDAEFLFEPKSLTDDVPQDYEEQVATDWEVNTPDE